MTVRVTAQVSGRVQGVGFRWWARDRAIELGLSGSARNLEDGRVEVVAEGERGACQRLLDLLREDPSSAGRPGLVTGVIGVTEREAQPDGGRPTGRFVVE